MDKWMDLIPKLFEFCIFPLLAILTAYAVQLIKAKMAQLAEKSNNELLNKYTYMLSDTITNCVIAVNQTYVDTLKKQGRFDKDAQKEAFKRVYEQVLIQLEGEAYDYLNEIYNDLDNYIVTLIEAQVRESKIEKPIVEETSAVG